MKITGLAIINDEAAIVSYGPNGDYYTTLAAARQTYQTMAHLGPTRTTAEKLAALGEFNAVIADYQAACDAIGHPFSLSDIFGL